jgi:uncharacterized membrane protein YccC
MASQRRDVHAVFTPDPQRLAAGREHIELRHLVTFVGPHNEYRTALDRLLDTAIGATLTLGIYALWPTWERTLLPDIPAELIEAERAYVRALFALWFAPSPDRREAVRPARSRARLARTNTEASVQAPALPARASITNTAVPAPAGG